MRDSLRLPVVVFFSLLDGEADAGMLFIDVVENHLLFVLFTTPVYLSLL